MNNSNLPSWVPTASAFGPLFMVASSSSSSSIFYILLTGVGALMVAFSFSLMLRTISILKGDLESLKSEILEIKRQKA